MAVLFVDGFEPGVAADGPVFTVARGSSVGELEDGAIDSGSPALLNEGQRP